MTSEIRNVASSAGYVDLYIFVFVYRCIDIQIYGHNLNDNRERRRIPVCIVISATRDWRTHLLITCPVCGDNGSELELGKKDNKHQEDGSCNKTSTRHPAASTIQDRWTGGQKVSQWVALAEYHNHHVICGNSGMCSKMWRLVHDVPRCMEPPRRCLWSPLELQTIHIGLTITEKALESTYKCFHI